LQRSGHHGIALYHLRIRRKNLPNHENLSIENLLRYVLTQEDFPPVFANPVTESHFTRDGYVVTPFFEESEVAACRKLYFDTMTEPPGDFFTTGFLPDGEPRRKVKEGLETIIAPHVASLMPTYSTCVRHFIVKRGRPGAGPLHLHQDFNFVDQSVHRAVHVWIALADVDERNGCLTVLPGSHRLASHISAMGPNATPYDPYRRILEDDCKVAVPMKAGEALFFDERTLHGSCPNTSPDLRIAMGAVFLPNGVKQRLYVEDDAKSPILDILEVESEILLNYSTLLRPPYPAGFKKIGTVEYRAKMLSPEVVQSLRRAPAARIGAHANPLGRIASQWSTSFESIWDRLRRRFQPHPGQTPRPNR